MKQLESYRFWAYAATFGALWGAVEITAGSFLHAIKLPFGSVGLAGLGVALVVTLRILMPVRGIVLAAGMVCACVKLLSPAGAVVGPMVGIMMESLLVELVLLPAGANYVSCAMAGTLACLWTITQKLITQTLFFGSPVIGIYKGVAKQAERFLHLPATGGVFVVVVFLCVVSLIGISFGIVGQRVGKRTSELLAQRRP
jgi:hypothetical protein